MKQPDTWAQIEIRPAARLQKANQTASANPVRVGFVTPKFGLKRNLLVKTHFSSAC